MIDERRLRQIAAQTRVLSDVVRRFTQSGNAEMARRAAVQRQALYEEEFRLRHGIQPSWADPGRSPGGIAQFLRRV